MQGLSKDRLAPLELVIFDMDGLLIDSERLIMEAFSKSCTQLGCQLNKHYYQAGIGGKPKPTFGEMFIGMTKENEADLHEMCARVGSACIEEMRQMGPKLLKAGARELLGYLRRQGIPRAVASSSNRYRVDTLLTSTGIYDIFDYMVCGDEIAKGKPDPETFLLACQRAGVQPERTLVLEDSDNGALAALRGGFPYIVVPDIAELSERAKGCALSVVESLLDVPAIIETAFDPKK